MSNLQIVYDGECPFCSNYVAMTKLRESVGSVELIDARSDHPYVQDIKSRQIDLNHGMMAKYQNVEYYGADSVHLLSLLSSRSGLTNRVISSVFKYRFVARASYPFLRFGRNMTLRIMGRTPIN